MDIVKRYDRFRLPGSIKRTDEGFIAADPVVTRTGVFKYQMPDGTVRLELRTPEEVFDADSLASAKMIPITNLHPTEFVTPENVGDLGIGMTGENVRRDEDTVRVPVKITNKDGVEAVEGGRLQLSLAYKCQVERKDGEFGGEKYTHVQRRIRYNHLALCDKARAGAQATLRLDAADAVMIEIGHHKSDLRKETRKMPGKVRLDSGIEYECPPEVEAAYEAKTVEGAEAAMKRDELRKSLDTLQGEHDALKKEKEELEKQDSSEAIAEGAKARVALLEAVKPMLGEEDAKKADAMSDKELQIAAIKAGDEKFDAEGKSDDYLAARFDAAKVAFDASEAGKKKQGAAVVGDGSGRTDADDEDPDNARAKMIERRDGKKEKDKE